MTIFEYSYQNSFRFTLRAEAAFSRYDELAYACARHSYRESVASARRVIPVLLCYLNLSIPLRIKEQ